MFQPRDTRPNPASRQTQRPWPVSPVLSLGTALFMVLMAGRTAAQTFESISEGVSAGRFILHPSVSFEYAVDDNVLYASADLPGAQRVGSSVWVIKPRILVDLPLGENRIRWVYTPVYRNYTTDRFDQADNFSHFFDLEGTFRIGPALGIRLSDHLVRGTVELREVDRGGELTFGLTPFTSHSPEMEITLDLGARSGVSILPRYTAVDFDRREEATFFGYRRRALEARFNRRMSPAASLYAFYAFEATDQNREVNFFGELALSSRSVGLGYRRSLNQAVVSLFTAGYKSIEFKGGLGHDFSGPVLEASANWQLSEVTTVVFSAYRQAFQSFFVNNNYYIGREVRVRMTQQLGRHVYWEIGSWFDDSAYADPLDIAVGPETPPGQDTNPANGLIDVFEAYTPSIGVRRRDKIFAGEVGIGYWFLRSLRTFIGYTFEGRRSNIEQAIAGDLVDPFNYQVNRVYFRIEAGWL